MGCQLPENRRMEFVGDADNQDGGGVSVISFCVTMMIAGARVLSRLMVCHLAVRCVSVFFFCQTIRKD